MNEIIKSLYNRKSMLRIRRKVHSAGDEEGHP